MDGEQIGVILRPHARARMLRLRYDAARGSLILTLPPRASHKAAMAWAREQRGWILKQIVKQAAPRLVEPGACLPWGEATIVIDWAQERSRAVTFDGENLYLGGQRSSVGARVARWLKLRAIEDFTQRTGQIAQQAGLNFGRIGIGDPRSRWGSCSASGHIRYSWRLIMAPDFVRHALVAHEVAHLAHMNHGPQFQALVNQLSGGDHARSRLWLKQHGRDLHLWRFSN